MCILMKTDGILITEPERKIDQYGREYIHSQIIVDTGIAKRPQLVTVTASKELGSELLQRGKGQRLGVEGEGHSTGWHGRDKTVNSGINIAAKKLW